VSLELKVFLALAPIALVAMGYALAGGDWTSAGVLAVSEIFILMSYRKEKGLGRRH
jgi:hypothetical protein